MSSFSKKKDQSPAPGFRTPSFLRAKLFGKSSAAKFSPATFKTQHKG